MTYWSAANKFYDNLHEFFMDNSEYDLSVF